MMLVKDRWCILPNRESGNAKKMAKNKTTTTREVRKSPIKPSTVIHYEPIKECTLSK